MAWGKIDGILTAKQSAFVDAFCDIGRPGWGQATKSAELAGYKSANLSQCAYRVRHTPSVDAAIQERFRQRQASAEEALAYVSDVMRRDLSPYIVRRTVALKDKFSNVIYDSDGVPYVDRVDIEIDTDAMTRDGLGYLIAGVKMTDAGPVVEIAGDQLGAADKILKAAGRYVSKVEHSGAGGGPLLFADAAELAKLPIATVQQMYTEQVGADS